MNSAANFFICFILIYIYEEIIYNNIKSNMNDCNTILDSILPFLLVISFICGFFFFRRFNVKKEQHNIQKRYKKTMRYDVLKEKL